MHAILAHFLCITVCVCVHKPIHLPVSLLHMTQYICKQRNHACMPFHLPLSLLHKAQYICKQRNHACMHADSVYHAPCVYSTALTLQVYQSLGILPGFLRVYLSLLSCSLNHFHYLIVCLIQIEVHLSVALYCYNCHHMNK